MHYWLEYQEFLDLVNWNWKDNKKFRKGVPTQGLKQRKVFEKKRGCIRHEKTEVEKKLAVMFRMLYILMAKFFIKRCLNFVLSLFIHTCNMILSI